MQKPQLAFVITAIVAAGLAGDLSAATQKGKVSSGGAPIAGATVTLYRAGAAPGSGAVALGSAPSNPGGHFAIDHAPQATGAVLYLVADGPSAGARLATVLGTGDFPASAAIDERTTVATAYALAQFIDGAAIGGKSPGLPNACATLRNLVNLNSGQVAAVLGSPPNGSMTSTMRAFNSLANMLAACVSDPAACAILFALATPPGGPAPTDTLQAAVNIAHFPWQNAMPLWNFSLLALTYQPVLDAPPETWVLALKYTGNGHEFDGPGNTAFDADGNAWISNNYVFRVNHALPTCGSNLVSRLTPSGADFPGAPYSGGGLSGQGFGVAFDPEGNVWVANFGFYGSTCPEDQLPPHNSVSKFSGSGAVLSPDSGFTQGEIDSPQGMVSDPAGNIWIANTCSGTVTQYIAGNPDDNWVYDGGISKPFGVVIDADGDAWFTDNLNGCVFELSPAGTLLTGPICGNGIALPLGIAIDSQGNLWVSNSATIPIPCPGDPDQGYGALTPDPLNSSVTQIAPDGTIVDTYQGGGMVIPWGISVDGDGNVWVADFASQRISELCGADPANCPPGHVTGQPISPTGYFSDAMMRSTAVTIDPSGNVWATNNWLLDPVQTNPGGDGMVVFIGLAAPVKAPLIGPPQRP